MIEDNKNRFNSSVLMDDKGLVETYDKQQLVPIVEYIPFSQKYDLGLAPFSKGSRDVIFDINGFNFISLVCFESTFPEINRKHVNSSKGVDALVYVVNDGWYETPPEPQQHAKQSIYRAIEFRRPVVRCANTGISQVIDKRGNITNRLELNTTGAIAASIVPASKITFYAKYGDIFSIINVLFLFILLALYFKRNK